MRVLGYLRCSSAEQADSGIGLEAQRNGIAAEAQRRGWDVEFIEDAGFSAKNLKRPGIVRAREILAAGDAAGLVVFRLDRLSRSMLDFTAMVDDARRQDWTLVALDLGVDTSTPSGEMMANVLATFAQFERRMIGQRMVDTHAVQRARGKRMGRACQMPAALLARIVGEREAGSTLKAIADRLTAEQVPTVRGGVRWHPSTIGQALKSAAYASELEAAA